MRCAGCGAEARAAARFCDQCGRALGAEPAPEVTPQSYTPRHLVERILTSHAALVGERKAVTVLFADVQGSMTLAEQVDAEAWHGLMNRFFAILSDGVHRFEGTVNQYTGDGIMALFGAPLAHEDHAQRACHAALHLAGTLRAYAQALRRERGLQFSVRMGINSGEVVIGSIGDDLRMDYTAQGHTVGLASRMEQLCEPGRVYLTQHTAALVEGYFDLEDLGLFSVKGVRQPLRVFALAGLGRLRTRLDQSRARGLSQFVGRAAEVAQLDAGLVDAAAGRAAPIAVVADAGTGKSRLCFEFSARCRARGNAVVEYAALPHGAAVPYLPMRGLLRALAGVDERDAPDLVRQKVAGALLLLDDAFKPRLPLLFDFLGVPDLRRGAAVAADAAAQRAALCDAIVAQLRARAASSPAVVLLEDLHWFDDASNAFLRELSAALIGERVLLLVDFRPEYDAAWLRAAGARELALPPLPAIDADTLLDALLGVDASLAAVRGRLVARAAGNPFFLEELVRSLVQSGTLAGNRGAYRLTGTLEDIAVPSTVQAVLSARIDRLAPVDKDVLQAAAVIGSSFAAPLLARVAGLSETDLDVHLQRLCGAELIALDTPQPVSLYAFTHPLTQEVAYGAQLQARRAALHGVVATLLAADAAAAVAARGYSAEQAARVADHWEQAGSTLEAARWHHHTARALAGSAITDAMARLRRVDALLATLPDEGDAAILAVRTADDLLRLGVSAALSETEGAGVFDRARALVERLDQPPLLAALLSTYADFLMMRGRIADANRYLREAGEVAQGVEDPKVRLSLILDTAQTDFWAGRVREALAGFDEGMRLLPADAVFESIPVGLTGEAFVLAMRAVCLGFAGRVREGAIDLQRALALADERGTLEGRCMGRQLAAVFCNVSGRTQEGLLYARTGREIAVQIANPVLTAMSDFNRGATLALAGEWREAIALLAPAASGDAQQIGMLEWFSLPPLANAYRYAGDTARALSIGRRAVAVAQSAQSWTAELSAQLSLAPAEVVAGDAAAAEAALSRAARLLALSGAEAFRPRWHFATAHLRGAFGDVAGMHAEAARGRALCLAMGMDELADLAIRELAK